MGSCLLPLVTFLDLRIFALIRKLRGENPKKARLGKIKTNGANSPLTLPPPKSPPLASTLLPVPPLHLPLGPYDGVVVRDDPPVSFLKLTKNFHVTAGFRKKIFPKDSLVFLKSEKKNSWKIS